MLKRFTSISFFFSSLLMGSSVYMSMHLVLMDVADVARSPNLSKPQISHARFN